MRRSTYLALNVVGLKDKLERKPPSLSGGEQQRVSIARALVNNPVLILADEPTGNLDHDLAMEIMEQFSLINVKGTTVIVATHDKDMVKRVGKRQVVLERGTIVDNQ
jgi:cell division transport system ATP-binding protein